MTTLSARNDRLADAYLAAALHRDPEAMLMMLVAAAKSGGTRNVLDLLDAVAASARDVIGQLGADQAEAHLRRRLIAAAINDPQPLTEMEHPVDTDPTATQVLHGGTRTGGGAARTTPPAAPRGPSGPH